MDNIEIAPRGSLDKIDTTVTVKMGTKHRLADLASKGESYDDVIARVLQENDRLRADNQAFKERLRQLDALDVNVIELGRIERSKDAMKVNDELSVIFSYNKPSGPGDYEYRMDVVIEEYIRKGKKVDRLDLAPEDSARIALAVVTKIINNHFDPAFTLLRKANVIDPRYWKKVYGRVGLPESSFLSDILPIINDYERGLDGQG